MADSGNVPATVSSALGAVARARNMSQLARDSGLSREALYKALSAVGNPSFATIMKVAQALGLKMKFEPVNPPRGLRFFGDSPHPASAIRMALPPPAGYATPLPD